MNRNSLVMLALVLVVAGIAGLVFVSMYSTPGGYPAGYSQSIYIVHPH